MQIPSQIESIDDYLERLITLLAQAGTLVFFDASLLLWLSKLSPQPRSQFFAWAGAIQSRIRVPAWAAAEFYKHYQAKDIPTEFRNKARALESAARDMANAINPLGGWPFMNKDALYPLFPRMSEVLRQTESIKEAINSWGYEAGAGDLVEWINAHLISSGSLLSDLPTIAEIGGSRMQQQVPPGFEDNHKEAKKKDTGEVIRPAKNPYGDLLFWQEVLAEVKASSAQGAIVVTNDRKRDWYHGSGLASVGPHWRKLRAHWPSVPAPHPFLSYELSKTCSCNSLMLVDDKYLGALLWRQNRAQYGRFVAACVGDLAEDVPAAQRLKLKLKDSARPIAPVEVVTLLDELRLGAVPNAAGAALLAANAIDARRLANLHFQDVNVLGTNAELAALARDILTRVEQGDGTAIHLFDVLWESMKTLDGERASAAYLGLLFGSYFDNGNARAVPLKARLEEVLSAQLTPKFVSVIDGMRERLNTRASPALYWPNVTDDRVVVKVEHDPARAQRIAEVQQIYVGEMAVLSIDEIPGRPTLFARLGGDRPSFIKDIVAAVCREYGIPRFAITSGINSDEVRLVPPNLYFLAPEMLERATTDEDPNGEGDFGEAGDEHDEIEATQVSDTIETDGQGIDAEEAQATGGGEMTSEEGNDNG